jgi:hypothetical protein
LALALGACAWQLALALGALRLRFALAALLRFALLRFVLALVAQFPCPSMWSYCMPLRLSSEWHSWFFLIFAYMDIYMHLMGVLLPTQLHWDLCVYPSHLQEHKAAAAYQYSLW